MKIESSTISMTATRNCQYQEDITQADVTRRHDGSGADEGEVTSVRVRSASLSVYESASSAAVYVSSGDGVKVGDQRQDGMNNTLVRSVDNGRTQPVNAQAGSLAGAARQLTESAKNAFASQAQAARKSREDWLSQAKSAVDEDPKIQLLRKCLELMEKITGRKVSPDTRLGGRPVGEILGTSRSAVFASYQRTSVTVQGTDSRALEGAMTQREANPNGYWTRQVLQSGVAAGTEYTGFSSTGTAVTSDGRTIDFGITVAMSRSFQTAIDVTGRESLFTDPLVINLDTDQASLADVTFTFDLDCDGRAETLSGLGRGSGFLALDKNGDGTINDGSELFGAKTGDGFAELAQYDQDGNGWIDENDEVFSRLKVWVQCGEGEARLLSLAEADVGAIFLGSRDTQFTLADAAGSEGAAARRTGIYLRESGTVGTVQHVDFKA